MRLTRNIPATITGRLRNAVTAQGLAEFALVIPLFLTSLLGITEFSWAVYGYNSTSQAANDAARKGMVMNRPKENFDIPGNRSGTYVGPACDSATIAGTAACKMLAIPSSRLTVTVAVPDPFDFSSNTNIPAGNPVSVTVQYRYAPLTGSFFSFPSNFTMTGYAQTLTQ